MSDDIAIKVEGLTKIYHIYDDKRDRLKEALSIKRKKYHTDFYALKDVSFEIKKGETVGIIGQNGSGKSTLLKILTGVLNPTLGQVQINGKISALLELGAGFNPEMTGLQNIYLNGAIMGYTKEEMETKVPGIVEFAEIGEFINQPVKMYSSGMFVRLAFAVAINVEPEILIIDEALAVGDALFQRKCFRKFNELKDKGITILLVSHDKNSILELCKSAILLNRGEKILFEKSKYALAIYNKLINLSKEEQKNATIETLIYKEADEQDGVGRSKNFCSEKSLIEYFDPGLTKVETIKYKCNGAEIFNCRLVNSDGKEVNVLSRDEEYYWNYSVRFEEDWEGINFGMLITNVKGTEIAGSVTCELDGQGAFVSKGIIYNVSFKFKPHLVPDTYFLNCGVSNMRKELFYLDRRINAVAFRVEEKVSKYVTGIVDLGIEGKFSI